MVIKDWEPLFDNWWKVRVCRATPEQACYVCRYRKTRMSSGVLRQSPKKNEDQFIELYLRNSHRSSFLRVTSAFLEAVRLRNCLVVAIVQLYTLSCAVVRCAKRQCQQLSTFTLCDVSLSIERIDGHFRIQLSQHLFLTITRSMQGFVYTGKRTNRINDHITCAALNYCFALITLHSTLNLKP